MFFNHGIKIVFLVIVIAVMVVGEGATEGIAGIGKAAHMNVAVFHVYAGGKPSVNIDASDEIGLLQALKGKAQLLAFSHTTGLKDGDVLMAATDILRDNGQNAEDFGVDCQLFIHVKNGEDVSVGGKCDVEVFDVANARQVKSKIIIKPMAIGKHWTLVGWDESEHVAVYVDEEVGTE